MSKLRVLVTGATGQQGGAVVRQLLAHGHIVRGFTRNGGSPAALALQKLGVEIVTGTFGDAPRLRRAMDGMDAVFAVTTPFPDGEESEVHQGIALADTALISGVPHFVFASVVAANKKTGIPHFDSKWDIEQHIHSLEIPHTVVAPAYFMENALAPWARPMLEQGTLAVPLSADRKLQQIAMTDLAAFNVLVIEHREDFLGKRIDIASDELTGEEAANILSRVLGRPIQYFAVPLQNVRTTSEDLAIMFDWIERVGYDVNLRELHSAHPQVHWHSYEEWARGVFS